MSLVFQSLPLEVDDETVVQVMALEPMRVVGSVHLEFFTNGDGYIRLLYVTQFRRREGIGQQLVTVAMAEAKRRGAKSLGLVCRKTNEAAAALYRKLGFERYEGVEGQAWDEESWGVVL